jgi:tetratricopeptide (TPR) repeat protein
MRAAAPTTVGPSRRAAATAAVPPTLSRARPLPATRPVVAASAAAGGKGSKKGFGKVRFYARDWLAFLSLSTRAFTASDPHPHTHPKKKQTQKKSAATKPKPPPSNTPLPTNSLPATPAPPPLEGQLAAKLRGAKRRGEGGMDTVDEDDDAGFEARLAALRADAAAASAAKRAADADAANVLLGTSIPDYDNPPPLAQTIARATGNDDENGGSARGSAGLVAGAAAVVLAGVFAFSSVLDPGGGSSSSSKPPPNFLETGAPPVGPEQRSDLEAQASSLDARLGANPSDADALRSAATIAARLGRSPAAVADYLVRLTEAVPTDAAAWRQLGAARLAGGDAKGAIAALERARAESPPPGSAGFDADGDAAAVVALAAARVVEGKPGAAVAELRAAAPGLGAPGGEPALRVGLALGKTLAEWKGHSPEAVRTYEELEAAAPSDYRPPLAKGVLLRSLGRPGEARRALLQARFLAPPEERVVVSAIIGDGDGAPGLVGGGEDGGGGDGGKEKE